MKLSRRMLLALLASSSGLLAMGCSPSPTAISESSPSPSSGSPGKPVAILNVSYDPTRELWKDINAAFVPKYEKQTATKVEISQSHGASGSQSRAIIDGLEGDVATLAMWFDIDAIRRKGLIRSGWEDQYPNRSLPYSSTIVFVVRKGNPKQIKDWPDLVKEGVSIIVPNPKTSANGKLAFLAAWGSVITTGGDEDAARAFIEQLYERVPVLDSGARAATTTFAQKGIGDVHLTWENEAALEVKEAKGELDTVYPSRSIRAEPQVAVVDAVVDRKGTRAIADAYLKFLYTDEGQEIIAKHSYRPTNEKILKSHADQFPTLELFTIEKIATDWEEAHKRFFADGAVFDSIYKAKK